MTLKPTVWQYKQALAIVVGIGAKEGTGYSWTSRALIRSLESQMWINHTSSTPCSLGREEATHSDARWATINPWEWKSKPFDHWKRSGTVIKSQR